MGGRHGGSVGICWGCARGTGGAWDDGVKRSRAERQRCERYEAVTESRARTGKKRTPRLRAPVGTPGETGVGRPDGRKPVAGEGAGPDSGGVTGNPVAEDERDTRETLGRGSGVG